jgi:hypothetical protein
MTRKKSKATAGSRNWESGCKGAEAPSRADGRPRQSTVVDGPWRAPLRSRNAGALLPLREADAQPVMVVERFGAAVCPRYRLTGSNRLDDARRHQSRGRADAVAVDLTPSEASLAGPGAATLEEIGSAGRVASPPCACVCVRFGKDRMQPPSGVIRFWPARSSRRGERMARSRTSSSVSSSMEDDAPSATPMSG